MLHTLSVTLRNFKEVITLATAQELSTFLTEVQQRAFKHALFAVKDEASALDLVQESMFKLAEKYSHLPAAELPPVFQRILQNTIRDYYRRQKIRNWWTPLFSSFQNQDEETTDQEWIEQLHQQPEQATRPDNSLEQKQVIEIIEKAVEKLPLRQREAFLLRYWEGLDVRETAEAMGCSEGSVKTHSSRALASLTALLRQKGITP
ncbi:RNA polymerase sigma factor [Ferrovum sp. PN-J185]|nr:RNA polymerase sigma factor [Ferrovum sp. PN-J185]KXW55280.1 RNA polymerase sigma factor SigV [Ferrovum sp. PN-J185]MCC6068655.1 RNA polymerase sigma factor [Ferrovum sp. PN-J185]